MTDACRAVNRISCRRGRQCEGLRREDERLKHELEAVRSAVYRHAARFRAARPRGWRPRLTRLQAQRSAVVTGQIRSGGNRTRVHETTRFEPS
jgi:hypothetical protein